MVVVVVDNIVAVVVDSMVAVVVVDSMFGRC